MDTNILDNIREEHEQLLDEMRMVVKSDGNVRKELFDHIKLSMVKHLAAVETAILERLEKEINTESSGAVSSKSAKDHHELKEYLQRLTLMHMEDDAWNEMFNQFMEAAKVHCDEEERKLFEELKEDYSKDELIEIGTDYVNVRARNQPGPS
jgi:small-conductance mechanosensitive channel